MPLRLLVFMAVLIALVCALAPVAARADINGYFCGNPSSRVALSVGGRCTHSAIHYLTRVSANEYGPTPGDVMCGLGKQYSDGSGGNTTPAVCVQPYYSGNVNSYCGGGYTCVGYATIIHQSGPGIDFFYGHLWAAW